MVYTNICVHTKIYLQENKPREKSGVITSFICFVFISALLGKESQVKVTSQKQGTKSIALSQRP